MESETANRIFENVRLPEEAAAAAAGGAGAGAAGAAAAEAAVMAEAPAGPAARAAMALGNALFFGGVAASAFFGYYTWCYDLGQVATMVEETRKPENAFVGSSVRAMHCACMCVRACACMLWGEGPPGPRQRAAALRTGCCGRPPDRAPCTAPLPPVACNASPLPPP